MLGFGPLFPYKYEGFLETWEMRLREILDDEMIA